MTAPGERRLNLANGVMLLYPRTGKYFTAYVQPTGPDEAVLGEYGAVIRVVIWYDLCSSLWRDSVSIGRSSCIGVRGGVHCIVDEVSWDVAIAMLFGTYVQRHVSRIVGAHVCQAQVLPGAKRQKFDVPLESLTAVARVGDDELGGQVQAGIGPCTDRRAAAGSYWSSSTCTCG